MELDGFGFPALSPLAGKTEPLTPIQTETELSRLISAITTAQLDLARFRKSRAVAYVAYRKAKLRAAHDVRCPKVERGSVTVAEREDWIDDQVADEEETLTKWDVMLEIGIEGLRSTLAVAEVVRSLNTSVRAAYGMSGYARENQ